MVFNFVRASTFLALCAMGFACEGRVPLFPTVVTLWNTWVHTGASERGYMLAEVE